MDLPVGLPSLQFAGKVVLVMVVLSIIISLLPASFSATAKKYIFANG